jgi:hypothetical protein
MAYWPERAHRAGGQAAGVIHRLLQLNHICQFMMVILIEKLKKESKLD